MKSSKNVYEVEFKSIKFEGERVRILTVVAGSFDEAMKKARENQELALADKNDAVDVVRIEHVCGIDIE